MGQKHTVRFRPQADFCSPSQLTEFGLSRPACMSKSVAD